MFYSYKSDRLDAEKLGKLISRSQFWTTEKLRSFQLHCLRDLLQHCMETVPFYRDRLACVAGSVESGQVDMDMFRQIPVMKRADIQSRLDDLRSAAIPASHRPTGIQRTSGSTGKPLTIVITNLTSAVLYIERLRWDLWRGRKPGQRVAAIHQFGENEGASRWGVGHLSGELISFSAGQPVSEQIRWLEKVQPDCLVTFPSNLEALLLYSVSESVPLPALAGISTQGEALSDHVRNHCREVLGLTIYNSYGAAEVGYLALQCPQNEHYHVQADNVLVEILHEDGTDCRPGETGRVVITSLTNYGSPLVRYDINDYAEVGDPCDCGRGLPVINRIRGRTRNMLMRPDGQRFWPIYAEKIGELASDIRAIHQMQLVQDKPDEITIRLVTTQVLLEAEETRITQELGAALGGYFKMKIEYLDNIPRTASGKFEDTICNIPV